MTDPRYPHGSLLSPPAPSPEQLRTEQVFHAAVAVVARLLRVHEGRDEQIAVTLAAQMLRAEMGES